MIILDIDVLKKSRCVLCTIDECRYVRDNLYAYCQDINMIAGHEDAMWYLCNASEYLKNSLVRRVSIRGNLPRVCIARGETSVKRICPGLSTIVKYRNAIVHATNSKEEVHAYMLLRNELKNKTALDGTVNIPKDVQEIVKPIYDERFVNLLSARYNHSYNRLIGELFTGTDIPIELAGYCRNNIPHMKCNLPDEEFLKKYGNEIFIYRNVFEEYIRNGGKI